MRLGGCPGWSETAILLVLSCRGSIMFKPMLLFHKTTAVCSFRTPSTSLYTWLIRPPLTIVPRDVSLQVLRFLWLKFYSILVLFSIAIPSLWKGLLAVCLCVHVLWFHVLSNFLLLLQRLPCTLLMLTSPFVLPARELSRYTCTLFLDRLRPTKQLTST